MSTLAFSMPADRPLIAAHRGATGAAPENTLAAIRWATLSGADLVEVDIRTTADGGLVLMHDETVGRTTSGQGRVGELTLRELQRLDAGGGESVPTLDDVLRLLAGTSQHLLLDVKERDDVVAPRLIGTIATHGFERRVLVGVRSVELLLALRSLNPEVRVLALVPDTGAIADYLTHQPDAIRLWARWALSDPQLARTVQAAGAQVWITAGSRAPSSLDGLLGQVDGFITDDPMGLRRYADVRSAASRSSL